MKEIVIAVMLTLALPITSFSADTIREGYWEFITNTMSGTTLYEMPTLDVPPETTKGMQCFTKEQVKDPIKTIFTEKNCNVTNLERSSNKATWKTKCTDSFGYDGSSHEWVYGRDTFELTIKVTVGDLKIVKITRAKRLGDCP